MPVTIGRHGFFIGFVRPKKNSPTPLSFLLVLLYNIQRVGA